MAGSRRCPTSAVAGTSDIAEPTRPASLGDVEPALLREEEADEVVLEGRAAAVVAERDLRALIDGVEAVDRGVEVDRVEDLLDAWYRAGGRGVDGGAAGVPDVRGPEDRQHEVGAGRDAPPSQGLAEVLAMLGQAEPGRDVEQAEDADRRVHDQAAGRGAEHGGAGLQRAVQPVPELAEVAEEVPHAPPHRVGHHPLVAAGDRQEDPAVEDRVEPVDAAGEALPRGGEWDGGE